MLASPLQRAWRTAELAGLSPVAEPDLLEWDYGYAEGRTTDELSVDGRWRVWEADGLGESLAQVAERCRRVLARVPAEGDTCLVAHGHVLRVLTAVHLGLEPVQAKHFVLEPTGIAVDVTQNGAFAVTSRARVSGQSNSETSQTSRYHACALVTRARNARYT